MKVEPRFENVGQLLFVGLSRHVLFRAVQKIPGQWQEFMSSCYSEIEHRLPEPPTGITTAADGDGIHYMCAAGVSIFGKLPNGCTALTIAAASYAVFAHNGHVAEIGETYNAIWNEWFPKSGKVPAEAPSFERHNPTFDPRTGTGGVTIWIPVRI
jgi:AraC family transcriptional regulator